MTSKPGKEAVPARQRFATRVRLARLGQAMSQEELADRAELHRTYVGSVERGERNISVDSMERIARALGLDIVDLLQPLIS